MTEQHDLTGLTYVAGETSPFKGQIIEIVGRDPHAESQLDRWLIRAPDGTERSVSGAILRPLVAPTDAEEEAPPPVEVLAERAEVPATEEAGEELPVEATAVPSETPPAPTPDLRFEQVSLKIVLYYHLRPDGDRQVLVGLSQPGQELLIASMLEVELGELPLALQHLIGRLEASFPARQTQIAEALKAAAAPAAPPAAPAAATKPHQRKPVGKPPAKPPLTPPPARPASRPTPPAVASAEAAPVPLGQTTIFDQLQLSEAPTTAQP
jgi:hypothetical protein